MNPKIEAFLREEPKWRKEASKLRQIALGCGLDEEVKWSKPCYTLGGKNVAIIIPFKDSCALMFCKGALLKDPKGILGRPGENSQSARWVKFTSVEEIARLEPTLRQYLKEAMEAQRAGREVKLKKHSEYKLPAELRRAFAEAPALKAAFSALTPGRQRAYILFIAGAKQSKTREARIEKHRARILAGKGLMDEWPAAGRAKG